MNEARAKQAFSEGRTVTMPTGAVVDNLRAYHDEEKKFIEQKKAQKENPAAAAPAATPAPATPRTVFADTPPVNRVMRSRGFGAGGPDVGDDIPGDRVADNLPLPTANPEPEATATPIAEPSAPSATATTTDGHGDDNQPG